jgi:hypothetical protein
MIILATTTGLAAGTGLYLYSIGVGNIALDAEL